MFSKIVKAFQIYEEAKENAVEETVNSFESKTGNWIILLSFLLIILQWLYAIYFIPGFEILHDTSGFYAFLLFFITSYFLFYLGSKLLLRPSAEELTDDTSHFALFSACNRKSMRSFACVGISIFHTLIFALYLINKDLNVF